MNEEMNNQEVMELTQEEEEELEQYDGDLNPVSLGLMVIGGGLMAVGGVTVGKKIYNKLLKPGFDKAKGAISAKVADAKAKRAAKQADEDLEVIEDDEE